MNDIKDEGFDENQFEKPRLRNEIQDKLPEYFASGGTIKRIALEKGVPVVTECDSFVPGVGAMQSSPTVKDTKVRVPRPEKKWLKK